MMDDEMQNKSYDKPPLTIEQQIDLLKERGLVVGSDDSLLKYYLKNVSYYHLSIYFKFFQNGDTFLEGKNFDDIIRIYNFDNKLRFLLLELLECIEKSFKCRVAYELSLVNDDAHCHTDSEMFRSSLEFLSIQSIFIQAYNRNQNEISILHYNRKYCRPALPPIWMMIEILSFGQCVKLGKALTKDKQRLISRTFGADEMFVMSWMHSLSILRNHCAHHSRLWNRDLTFRPASRHKLYEDFFVDNNRLYNYLIALQILLSEVNPTSSWLDKLSSLVEEYRIDVTQMGFPDGWKSKLIDVRSVAVSHLSKIEN